MAQTEQLYARLNYSEFYKLALPPRSRPEPRLMWADFLLGSAQLRLLEARRTKPILRAWSIAFLAPKNKQEPRRSSHQGFFLLCPSAVLGRHAVRRQKNTPVAARHAQGLRATTWGLAVEDPTADLSRTLVQP